MTGCSRNIIYFSMYRNGIKAEPAGHAVLWQNGAACRLEYHYRPADGGIVTPTYYFAGGASITGEPMAAGVVGGGASGTAGIESVVSYCVKTSTEHFLGSEKKASELEAICFCGTPMEYSGGRVDGKELRYANGEEEPHPAQVWMDVVAETALECNMPQAEQRTQMTQTERRMQLPYKEQRKPMQQAKVQESGIPKEQQRRHQGIEHKTEDTEGSPDTEKDAFQPQKEPVAVPYTFPELMMNLPKLSLPPDGIRRQCCRMELSDLEKFPKKWRGLENNHFLLHGYYQYHHLMLVQLSGAKGERYAVGVPGEFRYRDQYMAETFGFSAFYPLKKGSCGQGAFGYWYLYLT